MKYIVAGVAVAASLFLVGISPRPAGAGPLNFNLGSCAQVVQACTVNTDTGFSVLDFAAGGFDLRTAGAIAGHPADLFVKNIGAGDVGLGLFLGPQNEIGPGESVTLDLASFAAKGIDSGTFTVESLDPGETGVVTDLTGVHVLTEVGSSLTATIPITFNTLHPDVTLTAGTGSVLAAADLEVSVPEPSTILLSATALFGSFLLARRLRS